MKTEAELYLTEEFQTFSSNLKEVSDKKKARKEEFKHVYEQFQAEIKDYDRMADALLQDWNSWKNSQLGT